MIFYGLREEEERPLPRSGFFRMEKFVIRKFFGWCKMGAWEID